MMNTSFFPSALSMSSGVPLDMQNTDDLRSRDELVEKIDPSFNPDMSQWDVSPDLFDHGAEELPDFSNPEESLRRFASYAFNAGIAEREKAREKKLTTMRDIVLYYDGDKGARERLRQVWGDVDMERLDMLDQEGKLPELSLRLLETYGDGDYRRGGDDYLSDNDLWRDKESVNVSGIWNHFKKKVNFMVQAENRMRELREREHVNLSDSAKRYVLGGENALEAEERLGLFNAGVDFASLNRVRRAVSYIDRYVRDGNLFNDHMADELAEILGRDEDARTMFRRILFEKSRDTAGKRMGVTEAPQVAEGTGALAKTGEYMARVAAAIPAAPSGMWDHFTRSLETYRQNLKDTGREEMNPFEADRLREHFRKQGLNSKEIARRVADIQFEREKRKKDRVDIESLIAAALEGGEGEFLESASFLNRVSYKLGGLIGDWAPMAVPYAGWHLMFGSAAQRARMEGANMGLEEDERELRSLFRGASAASVEKIAFGGFGKMVPGFHKIQQWAGRGNAASWRARFASSPKAQMAGHAAMGVAEEAFLEPTAEYIMNSATDLFLNDERGKATFSGYLQEMQAMLEPDQFAALALFSVGMSSLNYGQLSRDSARFRDMLTAYKASGGTEAGLLDAMKQPDMKGALEKAVSHLHDAWMEDPQASMERASAAAGERLSGERIESLRELDAWRAAEDAGMVPRVEPAEQEGMFRVYAPRGVEKGRPETKREDSTATTGQQEESNQPSYTLMNGEQMTAYLQAFVSEQVESDILYTQHLLAGDVTVSQALAQGRFDAAEVITRTVTDEKTGAERVVIAPETLGQMKARADMAMAAIRALEAEGVSYEDAAARMDASLSEHLPLGTLVKTWEEAQERIRTEQARNPEFKAPAMDAPFSNAYVTKVRRGDTFRRVLRYARGNATVEDLMEEAMEQAVISWQAEQGLTWGEFGAMLQEAQRVMNELFPEARGEEMQFIHLDAGKPVTGHDAIEAFSKIGRSRWLADAVNHPSLPSWLRKLLNHLVKFMGAFKARVELGEMVRQAEEQGVFTLPVRQALAVMLDAGNALYRDQQGDLIALTMERAKAQADLDAALGRGVATEQETLEEQLAERNAADEPGPVDRAEEEADDANAQQARRERTEAEVEMLGERDDDGVFNGGVSIRIEDGVRQGFIDKDRLTLCPDVPQFKQGADEKTGVVNRIVGAWQRNAAPISVWRRTDGSLQVISGRHRLDACTDADINCTVYEEGERFDLDWARRHDVENNIRDGQASAFEIARYVRDSSLSMAEAVERGIARKGASLKGVELGLYASQELLDALGNGLISPDDAYRVALAFRNDAEVQRSGLAVLLDGGSWQEAYNTMAAKANLEAIARQNAANGMDMGMDLFGNTDNEELYKRIGKYAAEKYRELGKELTAINGASRNPKVARKYGVNVNDAAAVQQVVKRLQEERSRWKNFAVHPDLLKEANNAVMVEMGLKSREDVDRENGVLPLEVSDDSSPAANFSLVSIPSGEVITTAAEMRARLKPLQGKVFVNKNTGIQAVIEARVSGKTVGKAGAAQMSVANLKALGFSAEEARRVHYTATARIHELFENAEDGFFEEAYKQDASKAGAYHFFNTVDIEGIGAFDVNVTAIKYVKEQEGNVLYTLELTIENPAARGAASREGRLPTPFKDGVSTRNLSSYRSFVEKEKASIRKKVVADGTFMKAPNGKETNLTEDQWLSVRTAAFKSWFGDWEHDPENASKVVDENGEPRVVYHGTYGDFTVFDKAKIGSATDYGIWGRGFYFTNMENTPYGNKKLALFLNFRNPFIFNDYKSAEEIGDYLNIWDGNFHEDDRFGIFRPYATGAAQIADSAQERGHDGLIAVLGKWTEYIAFEPNQIKSSTDNRGTFDPKNPDITFSVIGPNAATWGKYADKAFAGRDDGKLRAEIDASQASLKAPENFPFLSMFDEWSRGMGYRKNPVWRGLLEDVLNFDELYEAYPSLRKMYVFAYKNKKDSARGYYDSEERSITINLAHIGPTGAQLSTLLHEIQHAIQDIEGFARGSNLEEGRSLDDYMRSAGEIESRNVEKRILWDGERRESKPFNDTLEFPGEAIVSFSIASAQEQGLFKSGHFEAGNAVITEPGVTFSIAALHASPHSFRKFSTDYMGQGEGAQAYGWGLYFAESPKVNRSYMNQFAQDKATWKFREVETGVIEVMQRSLVGSFLPKDALPEAKEDASDIAWSVLGDLVDAARGSMTVLDIVMELHDEIDTNRKYAETYPQEREKMVQLEGFLLSLLDHLDEIEARPGMPSNYKVELNVEDSELMGWDYVDETVLALLKDSPVEEVRYALERAERRADYRGENVSGKDVYQELFDAFWDGDDGTKQEAQKAASVSLLSSDIKGIRYADGYTRGKAEEEQTYNYVIFDGKDIKITAFADESTGGAWADYEDPSATFSIIGEKAESFQEYHNNGLSYTDPADGKRKAIIDSRGVRLRKEHVSVSEGGHVNVSLAAALDFPELFRAYPELRRLRVDFYRDSRSGTGGFTDPQEHYIAVNVARGGKNAAPGMVLDTMLHEVQHVIQGYEGFARGAGSMSREQALAYLRESMSQLAGRDDAWAKEALPRLERMRQELEAGTLQPAFVYVFSHGEQEARLAGRFEKNSEGVVMSGLNGFRLLDAPQFSIPLTGDITELGGITFGAGRFGRVADRVLAPNGDWLYDEMVFRMRAAMQRSVSKLRLYETGDRERGLELLAEAQELISTVERYLPGSYGFGLEPYKIWLNVFSLLYGNSGKMAPGDAVASALEAIPMKRWPEIMEGSIGKSFVNWAEKRPELEDVVEEARREIAERQADYELDSAPDADNSAALAARKGVEQEVWRRLFEEHGAEFLEEYGERKVFRLVGKFMERVVEQIDRFRKDRTLGRIRRVAASVAPRTNPKGKPLRGKMDAESYRRLERCLRLLEMTESQYDEFFQKNFPEDAEEGKRWEDLAPDALVLVTLPDAEGRLEEVAVTQREFEVYACYERMDVNTAEKCGAALGELIATSRHAWENAAEKKKMEVAAMAAPLLQATGDLDDSRMATFRRKARLRALPKKPLSLFDYLMNFNQYMQALSSVGPFAGIARQFEERAARFNVQRQASEKEMLRFVHNTVAEIAGSADRYDIAEWIYEGRMKQDTGISVVEREPDWNRKANALYRERLLHLLRRKVKSHGLEAVQLYLREFKFSEGLKKEVNALFGHRRKEISAKQAKKALEHMERVFTQNEWERYGDQKVFVRERAEMLRSRTKYAKEGYQPKSFRLDGLSRMEAAYLVLLSEQADYTEALAERGFDAEVMDRLRGFAGDEVMQFAYALREKLNERSGQVQEMTERRYGTPFPLTENYFRAFFDVTMEAIDKSIADAASYGEAATGGKFGLIHARRKHQAHLDLEMDVCTAFMAAMTEQDLYLYGSEISRDLRALLNFKGEDGEAGRSLEVLLGRDAVGKLMAWADAFDRAGAESIRGHLDMNRLMNRLSGAAARVLLAGRVGTLTKQATTVINAMYASDEIGLAEWLGSVRRYHAGKLVKPVREIEALPELDSRDKTRFSATLAAMGADEAGRRVSRLERWNREGMDLLERVDMKGNAISAAILYDAVYRKMKRETPDAAEAELDAAAMAEVRRSLSRKGQPMTQLQKSLTAQHRTWMQAGMLFLGGESINTMGNVFSLARSGQWGKAGLMWVSHGVVLALLNGLLNFMTDDEKRRRKREWWHALFDVAMGPVMGIPVVSGLAGEGVRQLAKLCGYHAFMPGNNLLVPFSNAADIGKAFSNAWKVFDGKERPWEDDALSFHELLRTAAAGTVAFSPRTTKGGAAAVGAALTMAALLNVTEFALKTVRSVQENGADWDKWVGK